MGLFDVVKDIAHITVPISNLLPDPGSDDSKSKSDNDGSDAPKRPQGDVQRADPFFARFTDPDGFHRQQAVDAGRDKLNGLRSKLASVKTADELLKPGEAGLGFFESYLPGYNAWTHKNVTLASLRTLYAAEFGLSLTALEADAALFEQVGKGAGGIVTQLRTAKDALVPTWQGTAASQFETTMITYFNAGDAVTKSFATTATALEKMTGAIIAQVFTKAGTVSNLWVYELAPGIAGEGVTGLMIPVARNQNCGDHMRMQVLNLFDQKYTLQRDKDPYDDYDFRHPEQTGATQLSVFGGGGTFGWNGELQAKLAMEGNLPAGSTWDLTDEGRELAQTLAKNWLDNSFVPQVERRLTALQKVCKDTKTRIESLFSQFDKDLAAVKDPYHGMSTKAPSDGPAKPTHGGGGGGNGSTAPTVNGGGGGSYGGPGGGSGGGSTTPTLNIPTGGGGGTTSPTGSDPGSGGGTTPVIPTPVGGTGSGSGDGSGGSGPVLTPPIEVLPQQPTEPGGSTPGAPGTGTGTGTAGSGATTGVTTNRDGSVTLGRTASGTVRLGAERKDGSVEVVTTKNGHTQRYRVAFGPNGEPVVTTAGAKVRTNPDGSISLGADHDVTIGTSAGASGFTVTQGVGSNAASYQVSYDAQGHPHATGADDLSGDPGASFDDGSGLDTGSGGTSSFDGSAGVTGGGHADLGGGAAGDHTAPSGDAGGGGGAGGGGTSGGHTGGAGGDGSGDMSLESGSQFDGGGSGQHQGGGGDQSGSGQGDQGGQHGAVGGVPLGAGAGRGGGGGAEDLKRRYPARTESVLDDGEAESWDRLGPTIG